MTLPELLKRTQTIFNSFIRERDKGKPCISCGKPANQAGHYFTVKQFSSLRFDERNVNMQCAYCNLYAHGNQAMYRIGLVKKIGEAEVKKLEEKAVKNRVWKWSREELLEIVKKCKTVKA